MKTKRPQKQVAALPYRRKGKGVEVLLVTSRETRRWVIPKGWPMKGKKDWNAAAREAYEEAGAMGNIGKLSVGTYRYKKFLKKGVSVPIEVTVYPLEVGDLLSAWPEKHERSRKWFPAKKAAGKVQEEGLQAIIEAVLT